MNKKNTYCLIFFLIITNIKGQVIFSDELSRNQINSNNLCGICYQDIRRFPSTFTIKNSTSFFISKNILITSAHNVTKLPFHSVKRITIFPARIRKDKPLDSILLTVRYRKHIRYTRRYNFYFSWTRKPNDFALIYIPDSLLKKNIKLNEICTLPIARPEDLKVGDTVFCAGYPAADNYSEEYIMTMDTSTVLKIYKNYFEHRLETLKGNSGSPIMIKRNGVFYVVGVNSIEYNGTFLNAKKQKLIRKWMRKLSKS